MYKDCDLPAKLFFKIINTGDYSLLGDGDANEQEQSFNDIFDEYFLLTNNKSLLSVYTKHQKIEKQKAIISVINSILYAITYIRQTREEREEQIALLNSINGVKINFDINKPIIEEIERVKTKVIGSLTNQLKLDLSTVQQQKETVSTSFERRVVWMSKVTEIRIPPNEITLHEFIEYDRLSKEIIASNNKQKSRNGK